MNNTSLTTQYLRCPCCSTTGPLTSFDRHPNGLGYWCCNCQTFIWQDPKNNGQSSTLLLEQKASSAKAEGAVPTTPHKFNKRLSPLRYPGGKSKLIDYLFTKLQTNKLDTFVEVFAGGASFGLALLDAGIIQHLVLNDADQNLITFWHEVLYNPEPLIQKLSTITPTHDDYTKAKEILTSSPQITTPVPNNKQTHSFPPAGDQLPPNHNQPSITEQSSATAPSDLAWAYLITNRLSYSGIQKGGCLGGKDGSEEKLLARYNPKALIKQITHLASLKDRITLLNQDYTQVIENYYWDNHTTLFIDPPYRQKGKALYNLYFTDEDHRALADLLQGLTREFPGCADILITYDNDPFIQNLYQNIEPIYINRFYSI